MPHLRVDKVTRLAPSETFVLHLGVRIDVGWLT